MHGPFRCTLMLPKKGGPKAALLLKGVWDYLQARYRKVTTCARLQMRLGAKVFSP